MPTPSSTADPLFLAFQTALAGRYSIDRELGRGGMGVVYLAREVHLDRLVAIKLLPPELAARPTLRQRFLREAQLAAKLSHPNIIPIHAVDETDGFVYFVMAYVDGETLAQRVASRGPLGAGDGLRLLREVAWALGYAHSQGLVHRDVKPDNILIEAGSGRALVADFGIAAAIGDSAHDTTSGTPEFMSPEQALGGELDARSDLYSLGATAFYALSGHLPFEGRSAAEVLAQQVAAVAAPLATVAPTVPRRLAQLVDWCLAKSPADRPASANAVAEQLAVTAEQRRDMPAALRAFVKRTGRLDGGGTILTLFVGITAGAVTAGMAGSGAAIGVLAATLIPLPIAFGVRAAARLLSLGFAHTDLAPAFRAERESSREERDVPQGRWRRATEWGLRRVARISFSTTAALLILRSLSDDGVQREVMGALAGWGTLIGAFGAIAYLGVVQLRRDVDLEFWSRIWTGPIGRWAFAIAGKWRRSRARTQAMTHRATELSLSLAAEELFGALPREVRRSLGDLPALLQRLQGDSQRLRERHDALHEALQQAGPGRSSEDYLALLAERDQVHERLRTAVAALESIRLGLLRLHAGSLSVEGLTTHLGAAAEVSADVERLIAAQADVHAILRFPRLVELTPT